ncbi:MAG: hypothetical protein ABFD86_09145 [Bryobacteraceae bacterium]
MTERERILAVIQGRAPDRLPWVPRLEFWYRAKSRSGTLPPGLRDLSLVELARKLGVGCYGVVPDFTELASDDDMVDYPLGILSQPSLVYKVRFEIVDRRVTRRGNETIVDYHTPLGSVRTAAIWTDEMQEAGASVPWISERAVKQPRDLDVAGYIFSHLRVEPRFEGYLRKRDELGDDGLLVAHSSDFASPVQHIMGALMPIDEFFYALKDAPESIERLAEQMEPFYVRLKEIAANSPAECVLLGGNYDDAITHPAFFRKHILRSLCDYATELHKRGKYLLTHTDGENRRLLPLYVEAGFDVAESLCPHPMTSCTLEEVQAAFAGRIAVWGGIASIMLCPESVPEEQFRSSIDALFRSNNTSSRIIWGVSDMVTADADLDRLQYITRLATS